MQADEQITQDGLKKLGFKHYKGQPEHWLNLDILQTAPEFVGEEGDRRWYIKENSTQYTAIPRLLKPKTYGQLHMICELLGVKLKNAW